MRQSPPLFTECVGQAERDEQVIAEVKMVLETYFMHAHNTFNTPADRINGSTTQGYADQSIDAHQLRPVPRTRRV